ncbi:hypothetical protein BTHI11S_03944 [Bosea thiooxidans]
MHGREIVARRPDTRGELFLEGDDAALEGLERHLPVAEILPAHAVEIVGADIHRQVLGPIVRHALELDEAALLEASDLVGARAERRLQRRGGEVARRPVFLREHRQAGDDEMQVASALRRELHHEDIVAFGLRRDQLVEQQAVGRMALRLQDVHREGDVAGRHARAVMEARLGPQAEAIAQLVRGDRDALRQQAVERARLVAGAGHQAVEAGIHAGCAITLQNIGVERVEGVEALVAATALDLDGEQAALRCLRVHIGEMREVRRQSQFAEGGESVRFGILRQRRLGKLGQGARDGRGTCGFQQSAACDAHRHRLASPSDSPLSCVACAAGYGNGWQESDSAGTRGAGARRGNEKAGQSPAS